MLVILSSDFSLYHLPGLNVKIPNRPLSRCMIDKDSVTNYGELEEILIYMLENQETGLFRSK